MPTLDRITIYPLKSLDGQTVAETTILASGALQFDRRWALVDEADRFVNAKRTPLIHRLRLAFKFPRLGLQLFDGEEVADFDIHEDRDELERWLGLRLDQRVRLVENILVGFPDDTDAPGPTIISTATLQIVASWFPGLSIDEIRRRFRANLEIGGVEPFWEDRLYAAAGEQVRFRIGEVTLLGVNPCQRCVVPSRDSDSGDVWPEFAKTFARQREATLPTWANRERFNHYYRLAVNTSPSADCAGKSLRVGASVAIK